MYDFNSQEKTDKFFHLSRNSSIQTWEGKQKSETSFCKFWNKTKYVYIYIYMPILLIFNYFYKYKFLFYLFIYMTYLQRYIYKN